MSNINTSLTQKLPVICDFGWFFGVTPHRLGDYTYTIGDSSYPPGYTTIHAGGVTMPNATVPTTITALDTLKELFRASGTITLDNGDGTTIATVYYTGLGTLSGSSSSGVQGFTGCTTTSTDTFIAGGEIYDPRYYVDRAPIGVPVTFDVADIHGLGLNTTVVPSGVSIVSYEWDFGNGLTGKGPQASTTYQYTAFPNVIAKLTVIDSLGRRYSCAHRVILQNTLTELFAVLYRVIDAPNTPTPLGFMATLGSTGSLSHNPRGSNSTGALGISGGIGRKPIIPLGPSGLLPDLTLLPDASLEPSVGGLDLRGTLAVSPRSVGILTTTGQALRAIARAYTSGSTTLPDTALYPSASTLPGYGGLGMSGTLTKVKSGP